MSSVNQNFLETIETQATKIALGGLNKATLYSYMLAERFSHVDFDTVFSYVSDLVSEIEDDDEFVELATEFAMNYVIDFETLMTIATVELAYRMLTCGMEEGLEQIH